MNVTQWQRCYNGSWNGILLPEAYAHPAKVAPGLSYRIYRHMLDAGYIAPGNSIIDPFGGIAGFGYHAMLLGLHWTGCELEPRFVELGQRNIAKWQRDLAMLNSTLGTARLLQGDSRRLLEVVGAGMAAAVSSPPYADAVNGTGEGPGARYDTVHHNANTAQRLSSDNGYGATAGQLGRMAGDGFEAAVSSPPYEHSLESRGDGIDWDKTTAVHRGSRSPGRGAIADGYGHETGNIGADTGETFWSAARLIVEQTYAVLKPGGHTAWVTKRFVRDKKIVEFSEQWAQLCEAVGFVRVERIHAMLVADHGDQLDIFGGATARCTERKSFFRRLAEKKGSPRIDHEDVIIMRKPPFRANGAQETT